MCKIKKLLSNRVCKWVPKKELDNSKGRHLLSKSKCVQKTRTKDNKKSLKVSQAPKGKKEERNVVYKQKNGSFKTKYQFFSLEIPKQVSTLKNEFYGEVVQDEK